MRSVGTLPLHQYAAPADGRTIATGLAVLGWSVASALALRGLSLLPSVFIHNAAPAIRNEIHPEIHIPGPADTSRDNVRQFQR